MLDSLAQLLFRRRRAVLVAGFLAVALAGVLGGPVAGLLDSQDDFDPPAADAVQARERLTAATGASAAPDVIALVRLGAPVDSPQARAKIARVAEALRDRDVAQVIAYRGDGPPELVSRDGRSTYLAATFRAGADIGDTVARLEARAAREPGVSLGGGAVVGEQVGTQVEEDLARAESLAFPILFVVSLFVFRSLVAALLPLVVGMSAILLTFLAMRAGQQRRADVDLRAQPHHRARPGPRDRLLAVHGLALPRGARADARHAPRRSRRRCARRGARCCSRP